MATSVNTYITGDNRIDAISHPYQWNTGALTYQYWPDAASMPSSYAEKYSFYAPLNYDQQLAFNYAITEFSRVANVSVTAAPSVATADINLGWSNVNNGFPAYAFLPGSAGESSVGTNADIWFNAANMGYTQLFSEGSYAYMTMMHELGHAFSLDHAHDGMAALPASQDFVQNTIMSYKTYQGDTNGYDFYAGSYPSSLMPFDIMALQMKYGANYNTNPGNDTYKWYPGNPSHTVNGNWELFNTQGGYGNVVNETIWDGGGNDTFDFSSFSEPLKIDLHTSAEGGAGIWIGGFYTGGVQISSTSVYGVAPNIQIARDWNGSMVIEAAFGGSGADTIDGNQYDNDLAGGGGNDVIRGLEGNDLLVGDGGNDTLNGGTGNDELQGDAGSDVFDFNGINSTHGIDTIYDFGSGDRIDLRSIDARTNVAGDQAFTWLGNGVAYTGVSGQLRYIGGNITGDVNGDKVTDLTIHIGNGKANWVAADFLL